jgi:hypothetical protein
LPLNDNDMRYDSATLGSMTSRRTASRSPSWSIGTWRSGDFLLQPGASVKCKSEATRRHMLARSTTWRLNSEEFLLWRRIQKK